MHQQPRSLSDFPQAFVTATKKAVFLDVTTSHLRSAAEVPSAEYSIVYEGFLILELCYFTYYHPFKSELIINPEVKP